MELLLHFVLPLHSNSSSSQIIYSMSRHVPFPSWLICLGYYRYFKKIWPCGWYILEEFTKGLCYNLYSATKMGDFGANFLFLCHHFSVSSVLQSLCSVRKDTEVSWKDRYSSVHRNSTVQIHGKLMIFIRKAWPSVLLSCRVTGEVDILLHGIADK